MKTSAFLVIFTIAIVVTWVVFIPKGEVSLHLKAPAQRDQELVGRLFDEAQSKVPLFLRHWLFLREIFDDAKPAAVGRLVQKTIPEPELSEALDLTLSFFAGEAGRWKLKADFDASLILDRLYSTFGLVDYTFVVHRVEHKTAGGGSSRSRLSFELYPSLIDQRFLPVSGAFLEEASLSSELAAELIEAAATLGVGSEGVDGLCERELCFRELSRDLSAQSAIAEGYSVLIEGYSHRDCRDLRPPTEECVSSAAMEEFEMAIQRDRENALAELGAGLVSLRRARHAVLAKESEWLVDDNIMEAAIHLRSARVKSRFVGNFLKKLLTEHASEGDPSRASIENLVGGRGAIRELGISWGFIESVDNYVDARALMEMADYSGALEKLRRIKDSPPYVNGVLASQIATCELFLKESIGDAKPILDRLVDDDIKAQLGTWLWAYLAGFFHCYYPDATAGDLDEADRLLQVALENLPTRDAERVTAQMQVYTGLALCDARKGATELALRRLQEFVLQGLPQPGERIPSSISPIRVSSAFLYAAEVHAFLGDIDSALEYLDAVCDLDPRRFQFISNSPIFRDVRRDAGFLVLRSKYA